jgi:hypothetical protein
MAVLLLFAACTPMTPAKSTSAVLPPERTWVIVAKPLQPATIDIARKFTMRGYALADFTKDDRGVTLRFRGERKAVAEAIVTGLDVALVITEALAEADTKGKRHHHHHHEPTIATYELGSVYYVRIEPRGETTTSISAIGRPTNRGIEACTGDRELDAPCVPLEAGPDVQPEIAGVVEAEVISGVFAELRLEGSVIAPDETEIQAIANTRRCWERRNEHSRLAARVTDPKAKAGIMGAAPKCANPGEPLAKQ